VRASSVLARRLPFEAWGLEHTEPLAYNANGANLRLAEPHGGYGEMPTRNVVLTDHHEKVISDLVASGRYQNASEVLRDGLRLIEERDSRESAKLKILQEAARVGFADFDEGHFVELESDAVDTLMGDLGRQTRARDLGTHS
jgi:antitoxin ParD1/3/4